MEIKFGWGFGTTGVLYEKVDDAEFEKTGVYI